MPSSEPVLQNLLTTMLQNPELRIEIQGHICCYSLPGDAYDYDTNNYKLSSNRARTVYDFLIRNGVEEDRLEYKGYGHSIPRYKEDSPENEQRNRRVEIRVLE
jgi:outer membrane protein OmpA-like peptidoglycan-associated protein